MAVINKVRIGSKYYDISLPMNMIGSGLSFDTGKNIISLNISEKGPFKIGGNGVLELSQVLSGGFEYGGDYVQIKRTAPLWFNPEYIPERNESNPRMFSSGLSLPFNMFSGLDVNEQGLAVKAENPFFFHETSGYLKLKFNSQDFRINGYGELELVK